VDDPRSARARSARLSTRDRQLLAFAAEHRLVLAGHIQALLGLSAAAVYARLRRLTQAGYLRHENVFHRQPGCYQVTGRGMAAIGSGYSTRPVNVAEYQHDVGLAWLELVARAGVFGPMREVIGERHMRSRDASDDGRADRDPFGVRLGGYGAGGRERLHYPDLLLVTPNGKRIAVELELSAKGRTRREKILSGYAADGRIDGVLYLVEQGTDALARSIRDSARRAGIGSIVHVQQFRWGESSRSKGPVPAAQRRAGRAGAHAGAGRAGVHAGAGRAGAHAGPGREMGPER
jgi:hypothetical protein